MPLARVVIQRTSRLEIDSPVARVLGRARPDRAGATTALELVRLTSVMRQSMGDARVRVAVLDGPVAIEHPDLASARILELGGSSRGRRTPPSGAACVHGTFVAGILSAQRGSAGLGICPGCTLLVRPIFTELVSGDEAPSASPDAVARAILDAVEAGAHVINLSASLAHPSIAPERPLVEALDHAARRGVIVVVAAGNQGAVGSSSISRHPWVIPVGSCDLSGRPTTYSNTARSIGRGGLSAPGVGVKGLGVNGGPRALGGTSVAAPFVTGTVALLLSRYPAATTVDVRAIMRHAHRGRRRGLVAPLLDAWAADQRLAARQLGDGEQ